jgi:CRP/FNR family cyclic AMP-dependent transcriptional regulator
MNLATYELVEGWPAGKVLFREGEQPRGVYVVHSGQVDLLYRSKSLQIVGPGQILGLSAVVSARPHDSSATARTPIVAGFIEKERFLSLLDQLPSLWFSVLQMLSTDVNSSYDCMRSLNAR